MKYFSPIKKPVFNNVYLVRAPFLAGMAIHTVSMYILPAEQTVAAKIFDMKYGIPEFCYISHIRLKEGVCFKLFALSSNTGLRTLIKRGQICTTKIGK